MNQNNCLAIILAAGKGTRMGEEIPKPLVSVYNKPIMSWIIDSFKASNTDIAIVINPKFESLFNQYKDVAKFIHQENQLGTGHAVIQASNIIQDYDYVFVFVGDSPFIKSELISKMLSQHISDNNDATILSAVFNDKIFPYARIVRDSNGQINKIVEEIDADNKEIQINELFGSHYLFKSKILFDYLSRLKENPKTGEIYFTDILNELLADGKKLNSLIVDDWIRVVGLNTKEDIEWAESQKMI